MAADRSGRSPWRPPGCWRSEHGDDANIKEKAISRTTRPMANSPPPRRRRKNRTGDRWPEVGNIRPASGLS